MKNIKNIWCLFYLSIVTTTIFLSSQTLCVTAEISCGELVDKITILMIKVNHITDKKKLKNILTELQSLLDTYDECIGENNEVEILQKELQIINQQLWDIEDAIRVKEYKQEFYDDEFITLARNVYKTNDKRCALKKKIDIILHSRITEEKSYEEHTKKNLN